MIDRLSKIYYKSN